jgi:hypothetical protein
MLSMAEAQAKPAYFDRLSINFSKAGLPHLGAVLKSKFQNVSPKINVYPFKKGRTFYLKK